MRYEIRQNGFYGAMQKIVKAMIRQTENSVYMETVICVIEFHTRAAQSIFYPEFCCVRFSLTMKKCSLSPTSN